MSLRRPFRRPGALWADRSGASAISVALVMVVVLGFVGLGADVGGWYVAKREAQNAADSAAYSAAIAVMAGAPDFADQARAVAAEYGLVQGRDGVSIEVRRPPAAGAYAGDAQTVEVVVARPARRIFSQMFAGASVIRARAAARSGSVGNACVIALHSTASASALETGSANVTLAGCSLFANSTSPTALELKGAAKISADSVGLVGGYSLSNNADLTTVNGVHTGQRPVEDPYQDVPVPRADHCDYNSAALSGVQRIANRGPTVFCNGLSINSNADITLDPGVYVIDRGKLTVNGGATLRGNGVTVVLTSSTGSDHATLQINGGAVVDLAAPTSGPTAGLALFQDRAAATGVENKINGGATQKVRGAIYFPNQRVVYTGGASTDAAGCTQLLAAEVAFLGNSILGIQCEGTGVRPVGGAATSLVE